MRVLVASHLYPSSVSLTSGSFVQNQVRYLQEYCDICVVSPTPWFPPIPGFGRWSALGRVRRRDQDGGVQVARPAFFSPPRRWLFSRRWRSYLAALERALQLSPQMWPELLHAHCAYPDGLAATELGLRLGVPAVITVHGADVNELPNADPSWRALVVEALSRAERVIANGEDLRRRVLAMGLPEQKVTVVPNGVDCSLFRPGDREPGSSGWRLVYVGRFTDKKGVGVLLEAMSILRRSRDDVQLSLVGGGATGAAAPYVRRVEELGLGNCVELVDEVAWRQIPARLAAADALVLPSFYESFGLVLVEAMACGLPVVATRCGGPEDIVDESNGILVRVGDAEDLARGLDEVLADYGSYDRAAIRRHVEQEYDYRRLAGDIHQVYEKALGADV